MLNRNKVTQIGLTVIAGLAMGVIPMLAGSAAVGSVAGSRDATLSGAALVPNTTVFSGDYLQVRDGVAVVALDEGNRMVFGRQTEASFLREAKDVTVLLRRGNVSMYHPGRSRGVEVKAGDVTVKPAAGYKTLGEVAKVDGRLVVTAKQGKLQVERQGRTEEVAEGKTVTLPMAAAAPVPAAPPAGNAHITTATTLGVLGLGAGSAAAVLAGIGLSRSNDAKAAANAATTAANNATEAGNAATDAANAAAAAANAAGCAENIENAQENPGTPSPYTPPPGYSCP